MIRIIVRPYNPTPILEPDIVIEATDAAWVLETKAQMGFIVAIKLLRLMTNCSLKTAHEFCSTL